jgi:arylformamidase
VHGGAWALGDKGRGEVWQAKAQRWLARGVALASVNYRLVPEVDVQAQVADLRMALLHLRRQAAAWGLDRERVVLVGHSAGAHLLALMAAQQPLDHGADPLPWVGSVLLDSAALDVVSIMDMPHARLYDRAFGSSRTGWQAASPLHVLAGPGAPVLAVCSSLRLDACPAAQRYAERLRALGSTASVLPQPMTHADLNARLGENNLYTAQVELFLRGLDAELDRRLAPP